MKREVYENAKRNGEKSAAYLNIQFSIHEERLDLVSGHYGRRGAS